MFNLLLNLIYISVVVMRIKSFILFSIIFYATNQYSYAGITGSDNFETDPADKDAIQREIQELRK